MRPSARILTLLSLAAATTAAAQGPAPSAPPARVPGGAPAAKMLLANTAELGLSDAQVVRLAAIARRSEARRVALRATMDSNFRRMETQPVDTAARRQFRDRMRTSFDREREQGQTDLRDAIAVLNADQQAKAWQMVTNRGAGRGIGRGGMRGGGGGMRGMRRAPGDRPRGESFERGLRERRDPPMRGERGRRPMRPTFDD
jgi:hypothetical protein